MKSLAKQIEETAARIRLAPPKSHLRFKLYYKLRDLVTRQLRKENRAA